MGRITSQVFVKTRKYCQILAQATALGCVASLSKAGYAISTILWGELIQNLYVMEVSLSGGYGTSVVLSVTLDKAEHRAAHILRLTCKKQSHDITKSAGRNRGLERLIFLSRRCRQQVYSKRWHLCNEQLHISEDGNLHTRRRENLKFTLISPPCSQQSATGTPTPTPPT